MENKVEIISTGIKLEKISYKSVKDKNGNFNVEVKDEYNDVYIKDDYAYFEMIRSISLVPKAIFSMQIKVLIRIEYSSDLNAEETKDELNMRRNEILEKSTANSKMSLLVAQITSLFVDNPLFFKPDVLKNNSNSKENLKQ